MLRKYPKYDIKLKYRRVFELSLILSLSLVIVAFKTFPDIKDENKLYPLLPECITVIACFPHPPQVPTLPIDTVIVLASDDVGNLSNFIMEETELDINAYVKTPSQFFFSEDDLESSIFRKTPRPIGGIAAIQKKIVYPKSSKYSCVQGKVFVKVFVDEKGNVYKSELIKGIWKLFDEVVMSAVMKTKFIPGMLGDMPIKAQVIIPISIKLI